MNIIIKEAVDGVERRSAAKLPSVEEALQHSPFTSVFPFGLDIIALPHPPPSNLPVTPLSTADTVACQDLIKSFDHGVSNPHDTSVRLEQTLRSLQQLLTSQDLTHYKLKSPPTLLPTVTSGDKPPANGESTSRTPQARLSPFARMLLNHTDVAFRYPTPLSPIQQRSDQQELYEEKGKAPAWELSDPVARNQEAIANNAQISARPTMKGLPASFNKPQNNTISILVPPSSNPSDYRSYPEEDDKILAHRSPSRPSEQLALNVDHQERTEAAFQTLQDIIFNLFAADDQLEPDTSGLILKEAQGFFEHTYSQGGDNFVLASAAQTRLENAIIKLMQLNQFHRIHVERLLRLQKICLRSLQTGGDSLNDDSNEHNQGPSSGTIEAADNSLRASKILVRLMTAGRDEKQLYSEEIIQEVLGNLRHVLERFIVPVVELRNGKTADLGSWVEQKELIVALLQRAGRVLKLLGNLVLKIDLSESSINTIEFMSIKLLFLENASSDKESILGIQRFETVRRHAMDVVSKIFLRRPEQRSPIFDEILTSLEKLPVGRQSARQFKIVEGKPIQLISALIMQLVQTSAMFTVADKVEHDQDNQSLSQDGMSSDDDSDSSSSTRRHTQQLQARRGSHKNGMKQDASTCADDLKTTVGPLYSNAQTNASYVVRYLVSRAMTSTKSGDEPYRNLLDIFVEDFLSVLGSTDWPAAQLLLTSLLSSLLALFENDKTTAPVRNMALELFGLMGSTIADLQNMVTRSSRSGEASQALLDQILPQLADETLEGKNVDRQLAARKGPYQAVVQFLGYRVSEGLQLQSAQGCTLIHWARSICSIADYGEIDDERMTDASDVDSVLVAGMLSSILKPTELATLCEFDEITTQQGRLAYAIIVLNSPFSKAYPRILSTLLSAVNSPQPTVRNKSLKSVVQILEKDPSILDRFPTVLQKIFSCTADPSVQVRESALGLLGKCMTLKPALEAEALKHLIRRTDDGSVGVRKRALKMLKEVYLRSVRQEVRVACVRPFLKRLDDMEESVAELAQQTLEELWISPFHNITSETTTSSQTKQRLREQMRLTVAASQHGEQSLTTLARFFEQANHVDSKTANQSNAVCKAMVNVVFDVVIDNNQDAAGFPMRAFLEMLTIFAKANAKLFTADQMVMLQPYITHLKDGDDRLMYRAVIAIYRRVLPILPPLKHDFLVEVQTSLFQHVSKLSKLELDEVTQCLWIIHGVVDNSAKLVRLLRSTLLNIESTRKIDLSQKSEVQTLTRTRRYIMIAGHFGKNMNLQTHLADLKEGFPSYKANTWDSLLVDIMCPCAAASQPLSLREVALENILLITQAWPKNFLKPQVTSILETVFKSREQNLELVTLSGFNAFFAIEEERSKSGADVPVGDGAIKGAERLGNSMMLTDNDGASTAIAQQYLPYIMKISLSSLDELALVATEVITSINRQGLVHPKESASALIALETSPNSAISSKAFEEHRNQHLKHESMLEKEYLTAVETAFAYQRDLLHDIRGSTAKTESKLSMFYDVLKQGSPALRKKLLVNLCSRLNFSPSKLDTVESQLQYSQFVLENVALFDYGRIDEIMHIIGAMEKIVTTTGNTISQRIDIRFNPAAESTESASTPDTDLRGLRELTSASIVLSLFWETRTYLKRTWSLPTTYTKSKSTAKDITKAPTRLASANPEKYLERMAEITAALDTPETMEVQRKAFLDTFMVDHDIHASHSEEDDLATDLMRFQTPDQDGVEDDATNAQSGGSRKSLSLKRKPSVSVASTPRKKTKAVGARKVRAPLSRASTLNIENPNGDWA